MNKYSSVLGLNFILSLVALCLIPIIYPKFIELVNFLWGCFAISSFNFVVFVMVGIENENKG